MLKKVSVIAMLVAISNVTVASDSVETEEAKGNQTKKVNREHSLSFDGFLNVKGSHGRDYNTYPFGPNNSTLFVANPVLMLDRVGYANYDITVDGDFSYGRSSKFEGYIKNGTIKKISENEVLLDKSMFRARKAIQSGFTETVDKPHFYRNYSRVIVNAKSHDVKVILGDVATRSTIGFQKPFSGIGINIARQGGNGDIVNPGLPIVITRPTKAEVRLGEEILYVKILEPGTYTVDDLGETARLPGVKVKLSDQLNRSETLAVQYFSGYDMPDYGTDDFDLTFACRHHYDLDDPYKMKYANRPRVSGNYRFTPIKNTTFAFGGQYYYNSYSADLNLIFMTPFGKISPNIGYSDTYKGEKAFGAGIYYDMAPNKYGIHFDANLSVQERGYGDLGISDEDNSYYDYYMDKYFSGINDLNDLRNGTSAPANSRSIIARLYSDPIKGFSPAFIFRGSWANNHDANTQNWREYSISLTKGFLNGQVFCTAIAGLSYDDPTKGKNEKSPDRRLTLACCVNLGSEVTVRGTYSHVDNERMRKYGSITYKPEKIPGLEIDAEYTRKPGVSRPVFTLKYDNKYFGIRFDEDITSTYEDANVHTRDSHKNSQMFMFGTSLTRDGIRAMRKNNFNIIRTYEDFQKQLKK